VSNKAKWTFMVYLAGDNNLSTAGEKDLAEMRRVGSTRDVNIVAEFDRIGHAHDTKRYHIQRDGLHEQVVSLGETDCGDPNTLREFIKWSVGNFPAERYALVLWNHGCGWQPLEMDKVARAVGAVDYNEREANERSASPLGRSLFCTTLEKIFRLSYDERAICSDDDTGHSLDTIELGNVLTTAKDLIGHPLDILGMDACLMSNLEVAYQAQPYVQYMVASEENEPADGWPYNVVLSELVANPDIETAEFAAHIVDSYIKSYEDYSGDVTQSALDVAKVNDAAEPLDELATVLTEQMEEMELMIWKAQKKSASFWHYTLWDIDHFCTQLATVTEERVESTATKQAVIGAIRKVRSALKRGTDALVIAEAHRGAKVGHCCGITTYLPSTTSVSRYYADLEYAKHHRWPTMLKAYIEA
jgi:hypothetical protein